jgi:indolepyruvate ferredoxin oxidoreductase
VAGDDHGGKSSDSAHQSEHTLMAAMVPILYPSTVGELIEFGLLGWAMSRYSGCYVGLKAVTDSLDISATVDLPDPYRAYHARPTTCNFLQRVSISNRTCRRWWKSRRW